MRSNGLKNTCDIIAEPGHTWKCALWLLLKTWNNMAIQDGIHYNMQIWLVKQSVNPHFGRQQDSPSFILMQVHPGLKWMTWCIFCRNTMQICQSNMFKHIPATLPPYVLQWLNLHYPTNKCHYVVFLLLFPCENLVTVPTNQVDCRHLCHEIQQLK